ncbi:DUF3108 domain-containing protein [Cruoricaptor ignavus]|uniref:DUF3108 domain-containing protein n=1 Tax=Cruoricaptor ignavus TaxID=1118202 RepID=A0A7M1T3Y3_9FLAO|nr:DUF3108 domain-containing protein [Cruoricaptor ignavus]QOR74550.1 DUF3108 domain-containing protein [Cruoricaptor ignavus]
MKRIFYFFSLFLFLAANAQPSNVSTNERLHFRVHYGPINAGTATLTTQAVRYQGQPHLYVRGVGKTTGAVKGLFKVEDYYESYINQNTGLPSYYVRNVREGGYTQHLTAAFNHQSNTLILKDKKNPANPDRAIKFPAGMQDMLSAFYYLRGLPASQLTVGSVHNVNVWIDDEMFPFQLKVAAVENLKTRFGSISALKILPVVKSGQVFKSKESVVMWVSNDANHIPLAIKADLVVGSIRADIESFSNVKYPLYFSK